MRDGRGVGPKGHAGRLGGVVQAGEERILDPSAQDVQQHLMSLLDVHGGGGWNDQGDIGEGSGGSAIPAEESNASKAIAAGGFQGPQDVRRIAAGGESYQDIAFLTESSDLPGEDFVKSVVVGGGRQERRVSGEVQGREGPALTIEAAEELRREMTAFGSTSPIAAAKNFLPRGKRFRHGVGGCANGCLQAAKA